MKGIGTMAIGIKTPFIKEGDDINNIVIDSIIAASENNFTINDGDIIAITESAIARSQNNFVTIDEVSEDIKNSFMNTNNIGVVHPIMSRNRFSMILQAIARATDEVILILKYPFDEVGNQIFDLPFGIVDIYKDTLYERDVYEIDPDAKHPITNIDYIKYYREIIESEGSKATIIFSNDVTKVLEYSKSILVSDIHTRKNTKKILNKHKDENTKVFGLEDIMSIPKKYVKVGNKIKHYGYNFEYGLLGSNISTDTTLKLFPRNSMDYVRNIKVLFKEKTGKDVDVLIYGDGAFKDPVTGIWELADPIVCPAFTKGLTGSPSEIKLKYLIDNNQIDEKDIYDDNDNNKLGTTPRKYADLLGSLSDLISGSGDKGTPVVYIKNYFKKYND